MLDVDFLIDLLYTIEEAKCVRGLARMMISMMLRDV